MSRCQWVITVDHITQGKRVGTVGPWDAELSAEEIQRHPEVIEAYLGVDLEFD